MTLPPFIITSSEGLAPAVTLGAAAEIAHAVAAGPQRPMVRVYAIVDGDRIVPVLTVRGAARVVSGST